jgi:hypothetical protein
MPKRDIDVTAGAPATVSEIGVAAPQKRWFSEEEAAAFLGVTTRTLINWRAGRGVMRAMPYFKVGRFVRYARADLDSFLTRERIAPRGRPRKVQPSP